jgi:hypothetical protein
MLAWAAEAEPRPAASTASAVAITVRAAEIGDLSSWCDDVRMFSSEVGRRRR